MAMKIVFKLEDIHHLLCLITVKSYQTIVQYVGLTPLLLYLLEKIDINVSANFEVKMGSGSSLKYCLSMSAIS